MALPRALLPLVKSPRFWSDYLFLTDAEYPSSYKSAFAHIEEDSDSEYDNHSDADEELNSENEMEDSSSQEKDPDGKSQNPESKVPHDGDDSEETSRGEPVPSEHVSEGNPTKRENASSSSSPSRPRSPYYSHTLTFPFKSNRSSKSLSDHPASDDTFDSNSEDGDDSNFNLSLSISPSLSYFELTFQTPNLGHGISIAHDDQAHWHPFVLRWEELELICKAVEVTFSAQLAQRQPKAKYTSTDEEEIDMKLRHWTHPGLALLFLYRFAPICVGDDVDRIVCLLSRAWKNVLGDEECHEKDIRRFIERMDFRGRKFRWFQAEGGNWWIGTGEGNDGEVYTYRSLEAVTTGKWRNGEWNKLIEEARAVVHDSGGLQELRNEDRELAVRFAPRAKQSLNLWLNLREKDRPLHPRAGRYFVLALDAVLRTLDMGRASPSGGSSTIVDGQSVWTSDHLSISLYGDIERGKAITKDMLWWLRAPAVTTLRDGATYEKLPFDLADDTQDAGTGEGTVTYLGICVPDVLPNCSWLVGYTLPDSLEDILRSEEVLQARCRDQNIGGHVSGPTKDGWLTVTTSDGGELGLNFSRFDGKDLEGTGVVALRNIRPQVSGVLHSLMKVSGAVLAPIGLAAGPLSDEVADISWPAHEMVDADTLYEILSQGPFPLWVRAEKKVDEVQEAEGR